MSLPLRAILVCLLALPAQGCLASSGLFEGPAVWAVALSGRSELFGLLPLKTGVAAVIVGDVGPERDVEDSLVWADQVTVLPGGSPAVNLERGGEEGFYLSDTTDALGLFTAPGDEVRVRVRLFDETLWISSPAIDPAVTPDLPDHPIGKRRLVVPLPKNLGKLHDGVLVQVFDREGTAIYDDFPPSALGWFDLLNGGPVPDEVRIPGSVFTEPGLYAVAVYALRQDDGAMERSPGLSSQLSGFSTGSALIAPVRVVE